MVSLLEKAIGFKEAQEISARAFQAMSDSEEVPISEAAGRVSATTVRSHISIPPFNKSKVDGYAVVAADTAMTSGNSKVLLNLTGTQEAGFNGDNKVTHGTCVKVPTGGKVPAGSDAIVMRENTVIDGNVITVLKPVRGMENVWKEGSDVADGDIIVEHGRRIDFRVIGGLGATGNGTIRVLRKMKISILSTGNEIMEPGTPYREGMNYDANSSILLSILRRYPVFDVKYHGIIEDRMDSMAGAIRDASSTSDVVISTGGTSMGDRDYVQAALLQEGFRILFHGVRVRPGMPVLLAMSGDKTFIGLPGFTVSAILTFLSLFMEPMLKACGYTTEGVTSTVETASSISMEDGMTGLVPVKLLNGRAVPIAGDSGSVSRILKSDGYLIVEEGTKLAENSKVIFRAYPGLRR